MEKNWSWTVLAHTHTRNTHTHRYIDTHTPIHRRTPSGMYTYLHMNDGDQRQWRNFFSQEAIQVHLNYCKLFLQWK